MKTIDGQTIVSMKAVKAIIKKYKVRPNANGQLQIEQWMVDEMVAWDQAMGTGIDKARPAAGAKEVRWMVFGQRPPPDDSLN
jgi:hypothetical protein